MTQTGIRDLEREFKGLIRDYLRHQYLPGKRQRLVNQFTLGQIAGMERTLTVLGHDDVVDRVYAEIDAEEQQRLGKLGRLLVDVFVRLWRR